MKPKWTAAVSLLVLAGLAACNLPIGGRQAATLSQQDRINTASAATIVARLTAPPPPATDTPQPQATTQAVATADPNEPTADANTPCNRAAFVRDVTVPDGASLPPNTVFTKIWELKNNGSCTWNSSYALVFAGQGNSMSAGAANPFPANVEVRPGESIQLPVTMRAPNDPGEYKGYWMLRSGDQKGFGLGANGAAPFFVEIQVREVYSFAEHMCSAQWSTAAGPLPCPGKESDSGGYVLQMKDPTLEDNQKHEGLALLTMPQPVAGGTIIGKFPPIIVPQEADFRALVGCAPNASGCYVNFKVTYRVDNGAELVLGEWNEGFENAVTSAIKDLDMVAGHSTAFTFYITVLGPPEQSKAIWYDPRITK